MAGLYHTGLPQLRRSQGTFKQVGAKAIQNANLETPTLSHSARPAQANPPRSPSEDFLTEGEGFLGPNSSLRTAQPVDRRSSRSSRRRSPEPQSRFGHPSTGVGWLAELAMGSLVRQQLAGWKHEMGQEMPESLGRGRNVFGCIPCHRPFPGSRFPGRGARCGAWGRDGTVSTLAKVIHQPLRSASCICASSCAIDPHTLAKRSAISFLVLAGS